MNKKTLALVLTLVFVVSLFSGFAPARIAANTTDLKVALANCPTTLDPVAMFPTQSDQTVYKSIYDTVVKFDKAGKVIPSVAKSWKISADGKTYTFKIRTDIKFHDGTALTAEDVAFSIKRNLGNSYSGKYYYSMFVKDAVATDSSTVVLTTFNRYQVTLLWLASSVFITPKAAVTKDAAAFAADPIGSGPYKFKSWVKGSSIDFERNATYFASKSTFKTMKIRFIADAGTQAIALQTGEVNFMVNANASDTRDLKTNSKLQFVQSTGSFTYQMGLYNSGATKNPAIREAIALAINKKEVIQIAVDGLGKISNSNVSAMVFPEYAGSNDIKYNPTKSRQILKNLKYTPEIFPITIITLAPQDTKVANVIASQLLAVGMTVKVQQVEMASFGQQLMAGKVQIYVAQGGGIQVGPLDGLDGYTIAVDRYKRFVDMPAYDTLVASLQNVSDAKKLKAGILKAYKMYNTNYQTLPLFDAYINVVATKGIKNVVTNYAMVYELGNLTY